MSPRAKARGGIDLGGTKIQTVVVSARSRVLGEARTATPQSGGPKAIAAAMAKPLRMRRTLIPMWVKKRPDSVTSETFLSTSPGVGTLVKRM